MDFASFAAEARGKKGAGGPVLLFAGAEALLRERGVAILKESDPELGANAVRLASNEVDWARVTDELYTLGFFAKRKLVVLVDEGNFVHNHAEALREYLKGPSPSAVLAVLSSSDRLPALEGAVVVECRSLKPGDLRGWVLSEAQRLGKSIDRAAAELLAQRGGSSLTALAGHVEKLAAHAGARGSITAEDVKALVGPREERQVYELSLAAASKDGPKAYRVLRALLAAGEAVQVLLWKLAWQYRKLAEAKKLLLNGKRRFEVTSQLQITYFADEFLRLVDGHSLGELVDKHGEILKADVALKTSGGHEAAVLEALVCRLAAPAGRAT
jgi:DNA polymerase-3 subunit delta